MVALLIRKLVLKMNAHKSSGLKLADNSAVILQDKRESQMLALGSNIHVVLALNCCCKWAISLARVWAKICRAYRNQCKHMCVKAAVQSVLTDRKLQPVWAVKG